YILSKQYYVFANKQAEYSLDQPVDHIQCELLILKHLQQFVKAKMKDFAVLLDKFMTRDQVRYLVEKMVEEGRLDRIGIGKATEYSAGKKMEENMQLIDRAMNLGFEELRRRGEYPKDE
ncbi:MAG: hypothetical protein ACK4ND_20055, partial [Cytophagaceae bacterium]